MAKKLKGIPTVVFEVAFSESSCNLAEDCGHWVACSQPQVRVAIGLDIVMKKKKEKEMASDQQELDSVWCYIWELDDTDPLDAIPANETLN